MISRLPAFLRVRDDSDVGYNTASATKGYKLGAITFDGLTDAKIDIQSIVPVFPEGTDLDDKDYKFTLQTFSASAGAAKQWWYLTEGSMEECEDGTGWYLFGEYEEKAAYEFAQGEGFMFQSQFPDGTGAGYTIAGEVCAGETVIPVNKGYKLIGNIRPATVSIQDLVPVFPEGTGVDDMDYKFTLQTFNASAGAAKQWWYLTEGSMEECEDGTGWYLFGEYEEKAVYDFAPGEGFMFQSQFSDNSGAGLKFPAIVAK